MAEIPSRSPPWGGGGVDKSAEMDWEEGSLFNSDWHFEGGGWGVGAVVGLKATVSS